MKSKSNGAKAIEISHRYVVADCHNLQIISYDKDFDKLPQGRLTPEQVLEKLNSG